MSNQDDAVPFRDPSNVRDWAEAEAPCLPALTSGAFDGIGITSLNSWDGVPGDLDHRRKLAENEINERPMCARTPLDPLGGRRPPSEAALFLPPRIAEGLKKESWLHLQRAGQGSDEVRLRFLAQAPLVVPKETKRCRHGVGKLRKRDVLKRPRERQTRTNELTHRQSLSSCLRCCPRPAGLPPAPPTRAGYSPAARSQHRMAQP